MKKIALTTLAVSLILLSMTLVSCFHTHEWSEWQTITDATCTENGSKQRTCECGEVETEVIEATGHTPSEETCKHSQKCLTCNEVLADALEHKDPQWVTVTEPTCTKMGSRKQVCSYCDTVLATETIIATGHTGGDEATCTTPQVCLTCNETLVQALGHKESEWIIDAEPTCTEDGSKHKTCSVCEETSATETIAMLGHDNNETLSKATPNNKASIRFDCKTCGHSETIEYDPIDVYAYLTESGVTIDSSGTWYYRSFEVSASGGYGEYEYKFETYAGVFQNFSTSNSTTAYGNMFSVGDGMEVIITVKDQAGQQTVYIIRGNGSFVDSYVIYE